MNCGQGNEAQRLAAVLWNAMNANSPVTRWVCCEIIARKLSEKEKKETQ